MRPISACLAAAALNFMLAAPASAITLTADYSDASVSGGIYLTAGGQLQSGPGGGAVDVTDLFKLNVDTAFTWLMNADRAIRAQTVTIKLFDFTGLGADGDSSITSTYIVDDRPATSTIRLDSSAGSHFFVDPTPYSNEEYDMIFADATLGGSTVNVGRYGTAKVGSAAEGRTDVLTLFSHELVHSMGLHADTPTGTADRKLTIPTTLTGFASNFDLPFISASNHIDPYIDGATFAHTVTAEPSFGENDRWLITGVEFLGVCVVDGCTSDQVSQSLIGGPTTTDVPEPASMLILAAAGAGVISVNRRRRQAAV